MSGPEGVNGTSTGGKAGGDGSKVPKGNYKVGPLLLTGWRKKPTFFGFVKQPIGI